MVREFVVDFFGILLPGFAFSMALLPTILFPGYLLAWVLAGHSPAGTDSYLSRDLMILLEHFELEIFVAIGAFSYIIGHLFFRQDPKVPDFISYARLPEGDQKDGMVQRELQNLPWRNLPGPLHHIYQSMMVSRISHAIKNRDSRNSIEFPYPKCGEYLRRRGLHNLADMIQWDNDLRKRTKHFINILKARIEFDYPEEYSRIARNEAHIRLVSSAWYASCATIVLALLGLLTGVLVNYLAASAIFAGAEIADAGAPPAALDIARTKTPITLFGVMSLPIPTVIMVPLAAMAGAVFTKNSIEKSFHYMRIREIVYVLAIAWSCHGEVGCPREPAERC